MPSSSRASRQTEASGATPAAMRWGLMVIAPNDLNWAAVRLLLQSMPEIEILADAKSQEEARLSHGVRPPEAIVGAPLLDGGSTLPLLEDLCVRWQGSKLIILVDKVACDNLEPYTQIPDSSCLFWNDLSPEALQHCLLAALKAPLRMLSASVAEGVAAAQENAPAPTSLNGDSLPARATAVLCGLADGMTEHEVATREGISLRTVQRIIADLQAQLDARSLFALGRAVERLGLLPTLSLATSPRSYGGYPPRRSH